MNLSFKKNSESVVEQTEFADCQWNKFKNFLCFCKMLYSNSLKHFSEVLARLHIKFVIILTFVWTDIIILNKHRKSQSSSELSELLDWFLWMSVCTAKQENTLASSQNERLESSDEQLAKCPTKTRFLLLRINPFILLNSYPQEWQKVDCF